MRLILPVSTDEFRGVCGAIEMDVSDFLAAVRAFDLTGNSIQTLNGSSFHMVIADRITVTRNNITELSDTAFLGIGESLSALRVH